MIGNALKKVTIDVTEGDMLVVNIGFGGQPIPTPAVLWWPNATTGQTKQLELSPDAKTATLAMMPGEVDRMIQDITLTKQRAQIDLGTVSTLQIEFRIHRTDRPNSQEEANV